MPTTPPPLLQFLALLGDFLSGLFAFVAFAVALWAVKTTIPNELAKLRHTKRAERRAEVAEKVWEAAFRLLLTLRSFANPVSVGGRADEKEENKKTRGERFLQDWVERRKLVDEASNTLLEAWALAELHLDPNVIEALDRLWKVRAGLLVDATMHAMNLDQPGADPHAWGRLFQEGGGKLDASEQELKGILGPIARHDLEHSKVPSLPSAAPQAVTKTR
jgi:hypothetical protein